VTGSASSVVGPHPPRDEGFIHKDFNKFANNEDVLNPNDHVKLLSESYFWNKITHYQNTKPSVIKLTSILPYFMIGPPLSQDIALNNSSCEAIRSIIYN
jgi:nucleoside-diphosphate-sugar epimerase